MSIVSLRPHGLRFALWLASFFCVFGQAAGPRIIAVGDVHGNLEGLCAILREARVIDEQGSWAGLSTIFVQTGDLLDRGSDDRSVLDFMMRLQKEAKREGGQVIALLGNHEVMNMIGDLRYVSPHAYASFVSEKAEKNRLRALGQNRKLLMRRNKLLGRPQPNWPSWEEAWMQAHPAGYVEHRQAFSRKGLYGAWLRKKPAIFRAGDFIFLHGGLAPRHSNLSIKEINKRIKNEIRAFDGYRRHLSSQGIITPEFTFFEVMEAVQAEIQHQRRREVASRVGSGPPNLNEARRQHQMNLRLLSGIREVGSWLSVNPNGPLWFRGYANWGNEEGEPLIAKVLGAFRARALVVGHTPQLEGIRSRFGGRVFLIDTGLLSEYYRGGRPSALEIEPSGQISAVYLDRRIILRPADSSPTH